MVEDEDVLRRAKERLGTVLLGKYRLDRILGVGGMAVVYAATHRNRKRFAVKMLHPELSSRSDLRARFVREGYVANSVNHPAVVSILDDDTDEHGTAFLVMELLDGESFDALVSEERKRLPAPAALFAVHELLDALESAHRKGILHRDVKPANLFATRGGSVKVLDFGIARLRDVTAPISSTRTGAMLGTPAFMAREQALGETEQIDERTDIWAAGATLFTLLSGELVHRGDNARQVMVRAATEAPRELSEVAPDLPAALVSVVHQALRTEKHERFASAKEMRDAVRAAHEASYGAFDPERIRALFEGRFTSLASSPTEASPDLSSKAHDDGASAPSLASQTVSKPGALRVPTENHRRRVYSFALAGAVLGAGILLVLREPTAKHNELDPKPPLPSAARGTAAPPASAEITHTEDVSAPAAVPSPAPSGSEVQALEPAPSSDAARTAAARPRPARRDPTSAPSVTATPAASEKKRANPLLIELQ